MRAEDQPAVIAVSGHLTQDERREADPAVLIERGERVPAEDVRDLHGFVRPPLRQPAPAGGWCCSGA
jgi:hypothetical protein